MFLGGIGYNISIMLDIEEIRTKVGKIGKKYGVERIYLFGSYARGDATEDSDIDLRIDRGKIEDLVQLVEFERDLELDLKKSVDVLTTRSLSKKFLGDIKQDEVLIYG